MDSLQSSLAITYPLGAQKLFIIAQVRPTGLEGVQKTFVMRKLRDSVFSYREVHLCTSALHQ